MTQNQVFIGEKPKSNSIHLNHASLRELSLQNRSFNKYLISIFHVTKTLTGTGNKE